MPTHTRQNHFLNGLFIVYMEPNAMERTELKKKNKKKPKFQQTFHLTVTIIESVLIHSNFLYTPSPTAIGSNLFMLALLSSWKPFVCDTWLITTEVLTCWFVEKCNNSLLSLWAGIWAIFVVAVKWILFKMKMKKKNEKNTYLWLTRLIDLTSRKKYDHKCKLPTILITLFVSLNCFLFSFSSETSRNGYLFDAFDIDSITHTEE